MLLLRPIRVSISIIAVLLMHTGTKAQIHTAYNIGSIGSVGSISPLYTGSVIIEGNNCFQLSNGVKALKQPLKGIFTSNCTIVLNNETAIKLIAYPNPVVSSFFFVKTSDNVQLISSGKIQLELFNITGSLMQINTADINQLNIGYKINMYGFASGVYYLKVLTGTTTIQLIKIIKTG